MQPLRLASLPTFLRGTIAVPSKPSTRALTQCFDIAHSIYADACPLCPFFFDDVFSLHIQGSGNEDHALAFQDRPQVHGGGKTIIPPHKANVGNVHRATLHLAFFVVLDILSKPNIYIMEIK